MATVKGVLGQSAPAATTDTDLYTVPSAKNATGRVVCTNRGGSAVTVRVWVAVNGAATSNEQYLAYDVSIAVGDTLTTAPFMVGDLDVVRVRASTANASFTFTGIEQDN